VLAFLSSCGDLTTVIDTPNFTIPSLISPTISETTIDTKTLPGGTGQPTDNVVVTVTISAKAFDSTGISGVSGSIFSPAWPETQEASSTIANFSLHDDGLDGDVKAGDSVFTATVSFEIYRYQIGLYRITLIGYNNLNTPSNRATLSLKLFNSGNRPPVLTNALSTQDTLDLIDNQITADTLRVTVADPESSNDILKVETQAKKPNGELANTIVKLYDDGDPEHADEIKGDGIFSTGIKLDPSSNPDKGEYTFVFTATDKSNAKSTAEVKLVVR